MSVTLAPLVGKKVVLQLRDQNAWLTVHSVEGEPALLTAGVPGEVPGAPVRRSLVPVPFLIGHVVEHKGYYAIEIRDEKNQRIRVVVNPDAILSVTSVIEQVLVGIAS